MNDFYTRNTTRLRKFLTLLACTISLTMFAQNSTLTLFQVNFVNADPAMNNIAFKQEATEGTLFDFVVLQHGEEIFRFRDLDRQQESLYSFILINEPAQAFQQLKWQKTLTKAADIESDLMAAYGEDAAFVGIIECKTATGATSRMQVAKMISEDDTQAVLSEVERQ